MRDNVLTSSRFLVLVAMTFIVANPRSQSVVDTGTGRVWMMDFN